MSEIVLLSDDFHINKRNFPTIYSALSRISATTTPLTRGRELWNKYGDYFGVKTIECRAEMLKSMSEEQLRTLTGRICGLPVNAFAVARSEILSFALAKLPSWYEAPVPNDDDFIFTKLYTEDPLLLRLNLAAVLVWCETYTESIDNINKISIVIVFSGSQIYQNLLLKLCQGSAPRSVLIESFFTGNEFYFEERYEPITKNSNIAYDTIFNSLTLPEDAYILQKETNKAINKVLNAKNKNVQQPLEANIPHFSSSAPMILISAQVQNDFSLLESNLSDLNPLSNYKQLLQQLMTNTDYNIILKTHPWEKEKTHLKESFTYNKLQSFVEEMPQQYRERIHLCEHENLNALINAADAFMTLGSQSAFEACFYGGLKPFIMCSTFYSGRGFTNDYTDISKSVSSLAENRINWSLSIQDYDCFLTYLTKLMQLYLPSVYKSGETSIVKQIIGNNYVPVISRTTPKSDSEKQKSTTPTNENLRSVMEKKVPASPARNDQIAKRKKHPPYALWRRLFHPFVTIFVWMLADKKKFKKYKEDPVSFFSKLKKPVYRSIGNVFYPQINEPR